MQYINNFYNNTQHMLYLGTSTDVSHYAGSFEQVFETTTAGITIQAPQVSWIQAPLPSKLDSGYY